AQIPAPARSSAAPGRPRPMARRRAASASGTPAAQVRGGTLPACSALQLALELVEEAPVGALRDDLLRARLDHAGLAQAKRIETPGTLGVGAPPQRVADLFHGLEGVVVAIAAVGDDAGGALRLRGAEVRRLEDRPQRPLGGHRVLADEFLRASD